jgi:hypothetical protein
MHYGKPTEGIWSLLKRSIANFAATAQADQVRIIKRKLKKIQYRPPPDPRLPGRHRPENRTMRASWAVAEWRETPRGCFVHR